MPPNSPVAKIEMRAASSMLARWLDLQFAFVASSRISSWHVTTAYTPYLRAYGHAHLMQLVLKATKSKKNKLNDPLAMAGALKCMYAKLAASVIIVVVFIIIHHCHRYLHLHTLTHTHIFIFFLFLLFVIIFFSYFQSAHFFFFYFLHLSACSHCSHSHTEKIGSFDRL